MEQTIDLQQAELRRRERRESGFLCRFASKKTPPPPQQVSKMCFLLGKNVDIEISMVMLFFDRPWGRVETRDHEMFAGENR